MSSDPRRPAWLPREEAVIADRYRLGSLLGAGGMGAVVTGFDVKLAQHVAVKFLNPTVAHEPDQIQRFIREAQATTRVRTEHVVRVLDVGATDEGLNFIVMERLDGADLAEHVRNGPLPIQLAIDCVLQACEALSEAHAAGIVHRDIKPSNLWLSRRSDGSPFVKVLDFGISKLAPTNDDAAAKLTDTRAVFGSPAYMSPEQIRSAKKVDAATDVWAMGVVLHELLTGRMPFEGESVSAVLASVAADAPSPLRTLRPETPAEVAEAVLACLEKERSRRISLRDLAERLRPHASLAGVVAANRLMGAVPPGPLPVARPSAAPASHAVALADTAFEHATTRPSKDTSVRRTMWIAAGLALCVTLGIAALGARRIARTTATVPATDVTASAVSTSPASAVAPSPSIDASARAVTPSVTHEPTASAPRRPRVPGAAAAKVTGPAVAAPGPSATQTTASPTSPTRE